MKSFLILLLLPLAAFSNNIFDSNQIIRIKITAPFQTLFDKKSSNNLTELKSLIDGRLEVFNEYSTESETYDVQLKMRGNMTLQYCDFPKLKIKFKKEQTTKKRLFNRKSYDLATHCVNDVKPTDTPMKIKVLSASPHRESFIFDLQRELELTSPLTRNAIIDYIDNSDPSNLKTYSDKDAFFIESTGSLIKRMGALYPVIGKTDVSKKLLLSSEVDVDEAPQRLFSNLSDNSEVSKSEALKLILLQILTVNLDFKINVNAQPDQYGHIQLWNVKLIARDEKNWSIYGNDFNLSIMITNDDLSLSPVKPSAYAGEALARLKAIGTKQDRQSVLDFYQSKKENLYLKIETIKNDPLFQKNYKYHLDEFYKLIDTLVID